MRWIVRTLGAVVVIGAVVFFTAVAPMVDRSKNRLLRPPLAASADSVRAFHRQLAIVDLHADPLLWQRVLLSRGTHGHVDIPRLIEGNVALQVFGVVTKTPPASSTSGTRPPGIN